MQIQELTQGFNWILPDSLESLSFKSSLDVGDSLNTTTLWAKTTNQSTTVLLTPWISHFANVIPFGVHGQ